MIFVKDVLYGADARLRLQAGINALTDAVRVTLGPSGRNVVIERLMGAPHITKDGVTVAKSIDFADPVEQLGAQMVLQAATKTAEQAGDGTTTATILAQYIVERGSQLIAEGANPMELRKGIDWAVKRVVDVLTKIAMPISFEDRDKIAHIASISANNNTEVGNLIADAMQKVGRLGTITIDDSKTNETTIHVVDGMEIDRGWISPYFVNNVKGLADFEDPYILLYDRQISSIKHFVPLLELIASKQRPLVIIADGVEGEALTTLIINAVKGHLKVCAVKAPGFGERRKDILEDIAILTGGTLIAEALNRSLESVTLSDLGTAARVIISKDSTIISGGRNKPDVLEARRELIANQLTSIESDYDKEKLQERLGKLSGGVGSIRVGAASELESKERKDLVEDALHATRAAIEEGIVAGGGVAYIRCQSALYDAPLVGDQLKGVELVTAVLSIPFCQILSNVGITDIDIEEKYKRVAGGEADFGFNAATEQFGNLIQEGVIDPKKVMRVALENAASVAATILTTEATVTNTRDDQYYKLTTPPSGN